MLQGKRNPALLEEKEALDEDVIAGIKALGYLN